MTFSSIHLSTILKYGGISFIAGAVNHGFFSESRSLWTAGFGILFYLLGAWLEMRDQTDQAKTWGDVLGAGIVFSIGVGFFTGGLQHFPDSPARSVWVVPLGFALSVVAMYIQGGGGRSQMKSALLYGILATALVVAGSLLAWRVLGGAEHERGNDGHSHSHAVSAPVVSAASSLGMNVRDVTIEMSDQMQFSPNQLKVKQGETIRFTLINKGKVRHEWVIGNEKELLEHADQMKKAGASPHKHDMANAISVAAGAQGTLTWTFAAAGTLAMACFEPGHYEAGMRGVIDVLPQ
ncbi:MAG: plastocyanin/azurin family copper-binding protein [Cytophagales bacterium]|nr:plastocyanin/azurin family copper-binding protein [Cytophagales bacterium]